jgi:hypothetical protein
MITNMAPRFTYDVPAIPQDALDIRRGGARRITHGGRSGVVLDDVFGGIVLGPHHLGEPRGTLTLWVMALEDLHAAQKLESHNLSVPDADEFTLFSDRETVKDSRAAHVALVWSSFWTPSLYLKRGPGYVYDAFKKRHAVAAAGHWGFRARQWYHLAYSWDAGANRHRLFANGVLVGHSDTMHEGALTMPEPGGMLCVGSTMFATGEVRGFDEELDEKGAARLFVEECPEPDADLQRELARTYLGRGFATLEPPEDPDWREALALDLTEPEDLRRFHIQGCVQAPRITTEGLRITTPQADPRHDFSVLDLNHVYLWSRDWFEGDLHISYEFQPMRRGGLSLLMTQCSGMQREDFLACHRPRTDGVMRPVCWEDIRNYHWEYYREMDDVRNDVASHAMLKNPWFRPLGFGVHGPRYEPGSWHRLDFVQIGDHIQCAIDGTVVIDARDRADDNNGPILSCGRFAIRCMTRTDLLLRNLRVRTRSAWDG